MSWSVSGRLSSHFPGLSWRFVNESVTSHVGHLGHARVHVVVPCFRFLSGQTLHKRDRCNYDLFLCARRGAKSNALSRDAVAVYDAHRTNQRRVCVTVRAHATCISPSSSVAKCTRCVIQEK